jgi:hypothetical protein
MKNYTPSEIAMGFFKWAVDSTAVFFFAFIIMWLIFRIYSVTIDTDHLLVCMLAGIVAYLAK